MEDFIIELLARLNTALSASQINNRDLPALEAMLKKIKITASLDNSKTAQQINKGVTQCQNQIKTLKINGKIDDNSMNKSVDRIVAKIENKSPKLKLNYGIEGINETGQTVTENINKGLRNSYIKNRILWAAGREILSQFTNAINTLKEVDTILTEISKTSDRTETSLKNLGETAFDAASEYGRTVQDYLTGIQEFARAGFDESGQEAMAKLSLQAQSAGDMTADLANEYLLVTNAAYKLKGSEEELSKVLDSQNYITNHNAVNMSEYANGMKVVAAQAASAGVKINELSALLGTAMSANQLGGSLNARGLKGILMNLQQVTGVDEEGESITEEDLTKYENACRALGVSLTEVKNGLVQLRNPVQILKELSQSYMQLDESDVKRANLINAVGGKYRGHVLNDILSNWDTYEKMLSEYSQGEGSAMREAEKTANSWEGRLTMFIHLFYMNADIHTAV